MSPDQVGYEVAEWNGLEDDWLQYKVSLDQVWNFGNFKNIHNREKPGKVVAIPASLHTK